MTLKKVAFLHPEEITAIVLALSDIPIRYAGNITPIMQLLNARGEMLVEIDIPDKNAPEKPKPKRAKKITNTKKDGGRGGRNTASREL